MILIAPLLVGCVVEPIAVILVMMPAVLPIRQALDCGDVHFDVLVVRALSVGFTAPPVGIISFAASAVSGTPFLAIAPTALPAFVALIAAVAVIAAMPDLVLWYGFKDRHAHARNRQRHRL